MLDEYNKVLRVLRKADEYSLRVHDKHLDETENGISMFEKIRSTADKQTLSAANPAHTIDEMDDNDIQLFLCMLKTSIYGTYVLLHYDEIGIFNIGSAGIDFKHAFNAYESVLRECRSIVVDMRDFSLVSLPFYKFMNMNENDEYSEVSIKERVRNAKNVEYTVKMDGSFVQITSLNGMYHPDYPYDYLLTSSGTITNSPLVQGMRSWYEGHPEYKKIVMDNPDYTLMFEWISENDKHVVHYDVTEDGMYFIGMRNKYTGELLKYSECLELAERYHILSTTVVPCSFEEIRKKMKEEKGTANEGYVMNADGYLVKLKTDDYFKVAAFVKTINSPNVTIRCIAEGNFGEMMASVDEDYKKPAMDYAEKVYKYLNYMKHTTEKAKDEILAKGLDKSKYMEEIQKQPELCRRYLSVMLFKPYQWEQIDPQKVFLLNSFNGDAYINGTELDRRLDMISKQEIHNNL